MYLDHAIGGRRDGTPDLPRWARVADGLTLLLIMAASVTAVWGGPHVRLGPVRLAVTSPVRLCLWAGIAAGIRHAAVARPPLHRRWFLWALWLGMLVRVLALPLPGTGDVTIWKVWSYNATFAGPSALYGIGGSPPERRVLEYRGTRLRVDYPPLALYELGAAGRAYRWFENGLFPDGPLLNTAIKLPALAAEVGLALLLFLTGQRLIGLPAARAATLAYWLNPAAVLDASILGYLDPLFVLPAAASIIVAVRGRPALAGALIVAAMLTKAQAVMLCPAVAVALILGHAGECRAYAGRWRARLGLSVAGACAAAAAIVGPIAAAGALPNLVGALRSLASHDMLSGNACSVWWIVGYIRRALAMRHQVGVWNAFTAPAVIVPISEVALAGIPGPRTIGAALTLATMAWAVWTGGRAVAGTATDVWLVAALGAFLMHAYATLSAQVHENHLFAAVPLLVLAAAGRPRIRLTCGAISAIVAVNLNLFYGLGDGVGYALPRSLTIVDATVLLALANCAALVWHGAVFKRECLAGDGDAAAAATAR